ncbi:sushi repeat-containing protein SRPX2-like [Branchiostoma floridae x Branchiostoma japonicum]
MSYRVVLVLVLVTTLASRSDAFFFVGLNGHSDCGVLPYVYGTFHIGCVYPYTRGETCYFRCFPGFVPVSGSQIIVPRTCLDDGTWSGEPLRCRRGFFFFFGKK